MKNAELVLINENHADLMPSFTKKLLGKLDNIFPYDIPKAGQFLDNVFVIIRTAIFYYKDDLLNHTKLYDAFFEELVEALHLFSNSTNSIILCKQLQQKLKSTLNALLETVLRRDQAHATELMEIRFSIEGGQNSKMTENIGENSFIRLEMNEDEVAQNYKEHPSLEDIIPIEEYVKNHGYIIRISKENRKIIIKNRLKRDRVEEYPCIMMNFYAFKHSTIQNDCLEIIKADGERGSDAFKLIITPYNIVIENDTRSRTFNFEKFNISPRLEDLHPLEDLIRTFHGSQKNIQEKNQLLLELKKILFLNLEYNDPDIIGIIQDTVFESLIKEIEVLNREFEISKNLYGSKLLMVISDEEELKIPWEICAFRFSSLSTFFRIVRILNKGTKNILEGNELRFDSKRLRYNQKVLLHIKRQAGKTQYLEDDYEALTDVFSRKYRDNCSIYYDIQNTLDAPTSLRKKKEGLNYNSVLLLEKPDIDNENGRGCWNEIRDKMMKDILNFLIIYDPKFGDLKDFYFDSPFSIIFTNYCPLLASNENLEIARGNTRDFCLRNVIFFGDFINAYCKRMVSIDEAFRLISEKCFIRTEDTGNANLLIDNPILPFFRIIISSEICKDSTE